MKLGSFSISLAVKDIKTSETYYETLEFEDFWKNGKLFLVNAVFFLNNNAYAL